jgi:Na+/melibiose symporter-like transporter
MTRELATSTKTRIFLTVPTSIGFLLAIFLLWRYPLHGKYLSDIRETLNKKRETAGA